MSPEEKKAYIAHQNEIKKNAASKTQRTNRPHWTETATPEQIQAWKDKMKAGRDKFWSGQKGKVGRPKKFNYRKGWNPAAKSAASKAQWVWRNEHRPDIKERFIRNGQKAIKEKIARLKPLKDEARWVKENKVKGALRENNNKKAQELYQTAKNVLAPTGVEPAPNMPIEYYQEIIDFFTNQI